MKNTQTFNEFLTEGYSAADKKILLENVESSIIHLINDNPKYNKILSAKIVGEELKIELEFEEIYLKITKITS